MKPEDLGAYYESILDKEARKEGGIYYTPPLIVEYMVAESVGELLKGQSPEEAAKITIIDPACGGGIFLLGAYQFLTQNSRKCGIRRIPLFPSFRLYRVKKQRLMLFFRES